jgi:hypothetical protein
MAVSADNSRDPSGAAFNVTPAPFLIPILISRSVEMASCGDGPAYRTAKIAVMSSSLVVLNSPSVSKSMEDTHRAAAAAWPSPDALPGSALHRQATSSSDDSPGLRAAGIATETRPPLDYVDGAYRSRSRSETTAWSNPGLVFGDVRIEVDAGKAAGSTTTLTGPVPIPGSGNHFFFLISSDGFAGPAPVGRDGGAPQRRRHIQQPIEFGAANHPADCAAAIAFRQRVPVVEVDATDWSEGDVGVIAASLAGPGAVIDFDNFSVVYP